MKLGLSPAYVDNVKTYRKTRESLKGTSPQCVALDPSNPNRAYCGTFGNGLWKTDDGGETWKRIRKEEEEDSSNDSISNRTQVMSVSVSHIERGRKNGNSGRLMTTNLNKRV